MKVVTKQVEIKRSLLNSDIENSLTEYGEPLRWAVVKATEDKFIIDAVFLEN